jgi:alkylation response protein AidB-like acyl-CoA dehydrogenase
VDLLLTEQQSLLAETAARLCADHGGPKRLRSLRAGGREVDSEAWQAVQSAQWLATCVAEARGGQGLGAFDLALALEQAGRHLLLVPLIEATAAAWALSRASDDARTQAALGDLLRGSRLIVPATEAASWRGGGGAAGLRYDHRSGVLDGSIPSVPYGASAGAFLVAIDSGAQPVVALVPREDVAIVNAGNVDGSMASRLTFARTQVSAAHVIATGAEARRLTLQMQEVLMLGSSVALIGLAAAALDVTLDYIKLRQQFGRPIGSFQILQHRAVDGYVDIELNRSLAYRVLAAFDAGEHRPPMVAAAKARASRTALAITRAALQMHGAIGYTEEHDIGLYYKRALALAAQYGGELGQVGRFAVLTNQPTEAAP